MNRLLTATAFIGLISLAPVGGASAVELLISGDFETPGGGPVGDVPGWSLTEFATGSAAAVDAASITGGADVRLFLQAFAGGGPLHPRQGNFDDDGLPRGDVDGHDFLTWQRNFGKAADALPAEGDATGGEGGIPDGKVDVQDYNIWRANFGAGPPLLSNARLTQTVPAAPGETYSFQGTSEFEDNYSGLVTTLGNDSPFGQIDSPTKTFFRMQFLGAGGAVLLEKSLDLRTENMGFFPVVHTPITEVAPAGTENVRVIAEALDMAWNGTTTSMGAAQSAFFNDFSLVRASDPGTDLLTNGNLNQGVPDALDFWNQVEVPATQVEILRTPIATWANHTTGGSRGVWLSAFFGAHMLYEDTPVDGIISQTVQAVAGGTYTFSGWTRFETNYSGGVDTISATSTGMFAGMTSPTDTEIKLEFLDVNQVVIGSAVIDVKDARRLISPTGNANDNQWYQHTLQAVSPAGTRFARLTAQMIDGVFNTDTGGGQSAFFDDFSLDGPAPPMNFAAAHNSVPEPSSFAGLALAAMILGRWTRRQ